MVYSLVPGQNGIHHNYFVVQQTGVDIRRGFCSVMQQFMNIYVGNKPLVPPECLLVGYKQMAVLYSKALHDNSENFTDKSSDVTAENHNLYC